MSRKIEEKVNSTFSKATPDISQSVIAHCKDTTVYRPVTSQKRSNVTFWKLATFALALVLVVTGVLGGVKLDATAQAAVVSLDVNPSIELKIDKRNRVKEAIANNDDAQIILQGMDLEGSTLDVAVYAIIGSMTVHGYLTEYTNSVLVSVDTKKESTYNEIIDMVTSKIQTTLKERNIESSVVAQWLKDKDQVGQIANDNNISKGKANLITKIVDASNLDTTEGAPHYTVEDLANRSVNELAIILAKYTGDKVDDCITNGIASEKSYIGKDQALKIALEYAGIPVDPSMDTGIELHYHVDFEIEKGMMVYEVEFLYQGFKYEVDVKAVDGEVVKYEKKSNNLNEDINQPDLTDAELIAKATEGVEGATNAQITERDRHNVEVTFQAGDYIYEVEISKKGTILKEEKHLATHGGADLLSEDKIKKIALDILSKKLSFLDDQIDEIDCELSEDGTYYEVEIEIFGMEFTFRIDAKTGEPTKLGGGFGGSWGNPGGKN